MKRIELTALVSAKMRWEMLVAGLPPALESIGLAHDDGATDGEIVVIDHGDDGCVLLLGRVALARRVARALATRLKVDVTVFEVVGSRGSKRFRFQTAASRATAEGGLVPADGVELDLEDREETWGGGTLEVQAKRVLDLFADLHGFPKQTITLGFRRRAGARPSTPRVATLLGSVQKAKSFEATVQPDGRVALRLELATGGTQTSFCSAAEHEELQMLLLGKAPPS
jgi:hypothetical protein